MTTQKYMVMLRNTPGKQEPPTPAQMQEMYAAARSCEHPG